MGATQIILGHTGLVMPAVFFYVVYRIEVLHYRMSRVEVHLNLIEKKGVR